ncbi:amidohydrolase family protein [Rhodococcus sp. 1R11]|uniref:metal-dependent hydrolase family protein n=1 Tax=Rhodococcus sp. 1R11 TaxID=2559614 RepID=UPI0010725233|nr:amidohydrolase family protein [Rhodococcus sp. 1R11]TFI43541.1 amidohydrolase family protein [Rhodococcus sp. 1R11]
MTTIFRAGHLADVRHGEVLPDQAIVTEGDRIIDVKPWDEVQTSKTDFVDLSEYLVCPGLIDLHTHLIGSLDHGSYMPYLTKSAGWALFEGVRNAKTTLEAGFTSVRDMGTFRAFLDCDLRDAINGGVVPGPRIHAAGGYVTSSSGGGEITDLALDIPLPRDFRIGVADSVDEVRKAVRTLIHGGADFIKVIATGAGFAAGTTPGAPEFSEAEIHAAVEEARHYGKSVAAHAHGTEGALRAVRAGVRTLDHGSYISGSEIFDAMKQAGTIYVPTTYLIHWVDDQGASSGFPEEVRRKVHDAVDLSMDALREAVERGLPIAYGTDAIIFPHGENAAQMKDFSDVGMTGMEILQSATVNAADALGSGDVGIVEPGRFADMVAIRNVDTVDDFRIFNNVDVVIKGGEVVR